MVLLRCDVLSAPLASKIISTARSIHHAFYSSLLSAIAAYRAALKGKTVAKEPRAPRGRRGEKRQAILDLIASPSMKNI